MRLSSVLLNRNQQAWHLERSQPAPGITTEALPVSLYETVTGQPRKKTSRNKN